MSAAQLRSDALTALGEWLDWLLEQNSLSRRAQSLLVLSICRILQTVESGTVTSKREAGEWALDALDATWSGLIQRALDDRPDPWAKVHQRADPEAIDRTLAFLTDALNEIAPLAAQDGRTNFLLEPTRHPRPS